MRAHCSIATVGVVLMTALLVLSPVRLNANVGVDGSSTTADDFITSTLRDALVTVTASLSSAHMHTCVVTASAGTLFGGGPVGVGGNYIFDLTRNGLAAAASARSMDFVDQPNQNDPNRKPVATNLTFFNLSGTQTFTFNARKATSGAPTLNVTESAISVSCQLSSGI